MVRWSHRLGSGGVKPIWFSSGATPSRACHPAYRGAPRVNLSKGIVTALLSEATPRQAICRWREPWQQRTASLLSLALRAAYRPVAGP
jgi:hypothetical protein